jgi:hypothetical protein
MDCEHGDMGFTSCSISCGGHTHEVAPQTSLPFLLPNTTALSEPAQIETASFAPAAFGPERNVDPSTPPPRSKALSR